jgi:hypothetical protein
MSCPDPSSTSPGREETPTVATAGPSGEMLHLTPGQLARWADLVAHGEADFPAGLAQAQEEQLRHHVRRLRRARLVQFIARQIALDVSRNSGPS